MAPRSIALPGPQFGGWAAGWRRLSPSPRAIGPALERWLEAERDQLGLWLPVGLGLGIAAWFGLPDAQAWRGFLAIAGGIVLAALALGRGARAGHAVAWFALAAGIGMSLAWMRAERVAAPILARATVADIAGTILTVEPLPARKAVRLFVSLDPQPGLPPRARLTLDAATAPPGLAPGARIAVKARLAPPSPAAVPGGYDFARVAWFKRIGAVGKAVGPATVTPAPAGHGRDARRWLDARRLQLTRHIEGSLAGSAGGTAAAFVTGDVGAIEQADADAMRNSGLAHLLSISGVHIAAVIAAAMLLTQRLLALSPRAALRLPLPLIAAGVGAVAGIAYTLLSGAEVPTVRSCVASLMVLAGIALGREAMTLRLVATGALIVLVFRPEALVGPSFQLSFAAVTAIIAFHAHPRIRGWALKREEPWPRRIGRELVVLLATGLLVEGALSPIGLYHFHRAGLYGALANIAAIPLTTFAIMPAEGLALLLDIAGLGAPAWWLAGRAIALLLWIARTVAGLPGAVAALPSMPLGAYLLIVAGGLWIALWRTRARRLGMIPVAIGAAWTLATPAPDLLVTDDGRHVALAAADGSLRLLRPKAHDYVRDLLGWGSGIRAEALDLDTMPDARCSDDSCVATLARGGRRWHLFATRSPYRIDAARIAAACRWADIVVSDRRLPRGCAARWLKLDAPALKESGGIALVLATGAVRTTMVPGDAHPWHLAAIAARGACDPRRRSSRSSGRSRARAQPNGRSSEGWNPENRCGPSALMWKQSSSRTPNRPGR